MIPSMISRSSTFSCRLQSRPFREALVCLILLCSASVSVVQAQQNETATNVAPTLAPTPFKEPEAGCYTDLNQVAARLEAKNAYEVETYTLCPNTVYKIGFLGSNGLTEDGFPALTLRQNTRYICGADGKSSNNCVITGGQFQLLSTYSSFNKEVKSNIVIKGVTFQNGQTAGALLVAPGEVLFEDCIFREHSNVGAASLIFFLDTTRRLLREMDDLGLETEQERVKHEVDFYAHLLTDTVAMQEWRQEVAARRGHERNLEEIARELQIKVTRQNVTFIDCRFEGNTYGEKNDATNYGTIGVETDDNDLAVHGCIFSDNKFGDINIVGNSYAINVVQGASLSLSDTCFVNNDFVGSATVILQQEQDLLYSAGNYGTKDDGVACKFMSIGGVCREYESTSCVADPTLTGGDSLLAAPEREGTSGTWRRPAISVFAAVALALLL